MPKAQINDINIYYEAHGTGEPLLLIHGLASRGEGWQHQLPTLSQHYTTIIFDNRGVGATDQPDEAYSIARMADDAAGLLTHLGIAQAHVFGVSMGGMIAQELALRHPHRVNRLALGCTHCGIHNCIPAPRWVGDIFRTAKGRPRADVARDFIPANWSQKTRTTRPELIETTCTQQLNNGQQNHAYWRQLMAIYQFDTYDRLPQITQPTLVLTGQEDLLIPPGNSAIIAERIPNARLVEFADASHLFFIESAAAVNQTLNEFLQEK